MANQTIYPYGVNGGQVTGGDFTSEAKLCLLETLSKVAWIDENGQDYIDDLQEILFNGARLVSISAVFTPGSALIVDNAPLDSFRQYLVVTAHFSDETTSTIYNYELSGSLRAGQSNVTVSYLGHTTTFSVTSVHNYADVLSNWFLRPYNGVAEYVNGYIRMKCVTSTEQSGYSVYCIDRAKTKWSAVNGKTLKFRLKLNTASSDVIVFGPGIYASSSTPSLSNSDCVRANSGTLTLAEDGYYEYTKTMDIADFVFGSLTPDTNSTFGIFAYARALNDYAEIYDVQIIDVTE